jgi:hypothetical protein
MDEPSSPKSVRSSKSIKSTETGKAARSKSPPKFGANAFDKRRGSLSPVKSSAANAAKLRGLKLDITKLSNKELISTFNGQVGVYVQPDRKTGAGATLHVEGKKLLADDIDIITEMLKRNSEVQVVSLVHSSINDTMLVQLVTGMKQLRHLKRLSLTQNLLSTASVDIIIKAFAKAQRKIDILDLRGNNLTFEDGFALGKAFFPSVKSISGIDISLFKADKKQNKVILSSKGLKEPDLGVICNFVGDMVIYNYQAITSIDVSMNSINARGLQKFVEFLASPLGGNVTEIDLSGNPLTNDCTNMTSIKALLEFTATSKQLLSAAFNYVEGVTDKQKEKLQRSTMVNRSVKGTEDKDHFKSFISNYVMQKTKALVEVPDEFEALDIHAVDVTFVKDNRLDLATVEMQANGNNYYLNRRNSQIVPKSVGF